MKYSERAGIPLYEEGEVVRVIRTPYKDCESVLTGVREHHIEWVDEMNVLCGEAVTISLVDESDGTYKIEESNLWWCNSFFESDSFISEDEQDESEFAIDMTDFLAHLRLA